MTFTIECNTRPEGSKPKALRRQGILPAALYGHKGAESISLTLKTKDAENLLKKAAINNTLVDVQISELDWSGQALIREVQVHPWKKTLHHLSFFAVSAGQKVELVVPIKITGQAKGIKLGGILEQTFTELKISCTPGNIPEFIEINITNFDIGSSLSVGEVVLPEGVSVLDDPGQTIFSIVAPAKMGETSEEETIEEA